MSIFLNESSLILELSIKYLKTLGTCTLQFRNILK